MEVGVIEIPNSRHIIDPTPLEFINTYDNPVVILYISTHNGNDPVAVRALDVTASGCSLIMEEPGAGSHEPENISYLIIESGVYELSDDLLIQAGTIDVPASAFHIDGENTINTGKYVDLVFDTYFGGIPAFFASMNTYNNPGSTYTTVEAGSVDVNTIGAKIFQELSSHPHVITADEVIGWLAISTPRAGDFLEGIIFETQSFNDGTKDGWNDTSTRHTVAHANAYDSPPIVFAQGITQNGEDGHWARAAAASTTGQSLIYAEEPYWSSRSHSDEIFSFLAFSEAFSLVYTIEPELDILPHRNIWTQKPYVYRSGMDGLYIYDLASQDLLNFTAVTGGVSSVWADDNYFYFGTTISGVFRGDVATVSGSPSFSQYKSYPDILSDSVNYLHGKGDFLCIATESGVDRYKISSAERYSEVAEDPFKCFQTTDGSFYYILNPGEPIIGLDGKVLDWLYSKPVYLDSPIISDNFSYCIEIPRESPYEIVRLSKPYGDDLRVLDDKGRSVPFFVEEWNSVDNPKVWVKLYAGTESFTLLYGGSGAISQSDPDNTFLLYDDFNGTELDESKWTWTPGYTHNEYHIDNSALTIVSKANQYYPTIKSVESFLEATVDMRIRVSPGSSYYTDLDPYLGFDNGGVYASVGPEDSSDEDPHKLYSNTTQGVIQGEELITTTFAELTIVESLYYQASKFNAELLTASGTILPGYRRVKINISNASNQPDLEVDWVRVRHTDANTPGYTFGSATYTYQIISYSSLHAVYGTTASAGFVYTGEPTNVLDSTYINDIYVTEDTSKYGGNVLFLGTNHGAQVIEERRGDELNCRKRLYVISS
jgi:hypothetical protein